MHRIAASAVGLLIASVSHAQVISMSWTTLDCGGASSSGSGYLVQGTIGQTDTDVLYGSGYTVSGGFWSGIGSTPACYANCDYSTVAPTLTANDFICFLTAYAESRSYANCDGSTGNPALTANDFICYLSKYASGCS